MGLIEKLLPNIIPLTEEQLKTFVEQTVLTEHSRRILDRLTAQNAATAPAQGTATAGKDNPACRQDRPHSAGGRRRQGARRKGNGIVERGWEGVVNGESHIQKT